MSRFSYLVNYLEKICNTSAEDYATLSIYADIPLLENYIREEKEEINLFLKLDHIRFKATDHYYLKLIFEREDEADPKNGVIKKIIAHIFLSFEMFVKLGYYLKRLVDNNADLNKVKGILNYLKSIIGDYSRFTESFRQLRSNFESKSIMPIPIWYIEIPSPDNIYCIIDELFYFNENGILISPSITLGSFLSMRSSESRLMLEGCFRYFWRHPSYFILVWLALSDDMKRA